MPTVLIVDDERDITSFLGSFFERAGHQVLKAYTGEEAVALVRQRRPDLVLLDLRLPDITGFEVLERVKAEHPVVIMITGHGDVSLAVRAMQAGAESFLTKPIELAHLGAAAERAFEKAHLRQMNTYLTARRGQLPARAMLGSSAPMRSSPPRSSSWRGASAPRCCWRGRWARARGGWPTPCTARARAPLSVSSK